MMISLNMVGQKEVYGPHKNNHRYVGCRLERIRSYYTVFTVCIANGHVLMRYMKGQLSPKQTQWGCVLEAIKRMLMISNRVSEGQIS